MLEGTCRALAAGHREAEMNRDELIADDRGIAAWDTHDVDAFAAMFADNFVYTDDTVQGAMTSLDQVREFMSGWFTAFPDMKVKEQNRVVGDDTVAAEVEFTGTNGGPLSMGGMELPATGRQITGHGTYFVRDLAGLKGLLDQPGVIGRADDLDAGGAGEIGPILYVFAHPRVRQPAASSTVSTSAIVVILSVSLQTSLASF